MRRLTLIKKKKKVCIHFLEFNKIMTDTHFFNLGKLCTQILSNQILPKIIKLKNKTNETGQKTA